MRQPYLYAVRKQINLSTNIPVEKEKISHIIGKDSYLCETSKLTVINHIQTHIL